MESTTLYFKQGSSDKEYHAAIEPKDGGYIVTFAYGRRDNPHGWNQNAHSSLLRRCKGHLRQAHQGEDNQGIHH